MEITDYIQMNRTKRVLRVVLKETLDSDPITRHIAFHYIPTDYEVEQAIRRIARKTGKEMVYIVSKELLHPDEYHILY